MGVSVGKVGRKSVMEGRMEGGKDGRKEGGNENASTE